VDTTDQKGPSSAFGSKASIVHKKVPNKAESRGSMPFDFCIGASRVIAVAATKLRKRTLAILAAIMSSLWMLSNGSRPGIPATPITTSAVKTTTTAALAVQSSQRLTVNSPAILFPVGSIGFIEFDIRHRLYLVLSSSAKVIRQALEI
jgi:hypothetical protein